MLLGWGKCAIKHAKSVDGVSQEPWTEIDTPKKDSTKVTTTAGEEITAQEEGGAVIDTRYGKASYQLEFDLFVKKGKPLPFTDDDGIIAGEHAFRIVPIEDEELPGAQIDRAVIRCEQNYSTADGRTVHYVVKCLKPASGKTVKEYTEPASA